MAYLYGRREKQGKFIYLLVDTYPYTRVVGRNLSFFNHHQQQQRWWQDINEAVTSYFQDLQSEIESHRIIYDRLDGTGRKLLGSLTSQEDAVMLQRRLDEMNSRWNNLKSKSIAIR